MMVDFPGRQQVFYVPHPIAKEGAAMTKRPKTGHTEPTSIEDPEKTEDEMVNDSLGTIDIADSTGVDEEKETGDAKAGNSDTHED
jgi:hypothetical protein